jgi:hypothetical protein
MSFRVIVHILRILWSIKKTGAAVARCGHPGVENSPQEDLNDECKTFLGTDSRPDRAGLRGLHVDPRRRSRAISGRSRWRRLQHSAESVSRVRLDRRNLQRRLFAWRPQSVLVALYRPRCRQLLSRRRLWLLLLAQPVPLQHVRRSWSACLSGEPHSGRDRPVPVLHVQGTGRLLLPGGRLVTHSVTAF